MAGEQNGRAIEKKGGMAAPVNVTRPQKAPEKPKDSSTSATPSAKDTA
jgi:hypothetical protein